MFGRIFCAAAFAVATFACLSGPTSAKPRTPSVNVDAVDDAPEGASEAKTRAVSRFRRTAAAQPPEKPADLREPEAPAAPRSLFSLLPSPAAEPAPASPAPTAFAEPSTSWFGTLFGQAPAQARGERLPPLAGRAQIDAMITKYAQLNGVPEALVHRIVIRESKYNPRAVGQGGAMGLMQIKTGTARAIGYQGGPTGLLDAETNLIYAVKYLAGAYRTADGNHDLAVSHYARGYYYAAKRKGTLETASSETPRSRRRGRKVEEADATPAEPPAPAPRSLFSFAAAPSERTDR